MNPSRIISIKTNSGEPVSAGSLELVPESRSMRLAIPGANRAIAWARPYRVKVKGPGGREETLRVRDYTRMANLAITVSAAAVAVFLLRTRKVIARRSSP